ncbi:MAG: hypothetical protein K2Q22_14130, partial [Cytophagales bacterium]|nr:hypothetical protein [Cytophagales bacterium]
KKKDAWVNELDIAILLDDYDVSQLKLIKWVKLPDFAMLEKVLKQLAKDILNGTRNSMGGVSF